MVALSRRSFLALAGVPRLAALARDRSLAWTRSQARPPEVTIVEFSDAGVRGRAVRVPKVVKSDAEWRQLLSPLAFDVARRGGTERPFSGEYWNLHDTGFFRCVCCGTALFSSAQKFDSGTGWPSFWDVIARENVVTHASRSETFVESDLTCRRCDAHLGDVFDDGPRPTGLRYCIDSVSLKFIPTRRAET